MKKKIALLFAVILFSITNIAAAINFDPYITEKSEYTQEKPGLFLATVEPGTEIEDILVINVKDLESAVLMDLSIKERNQLSKDSNMNSWFEFPEGDQFQIEKKGILKLPVKINIPESTLPGQYDSYIQALPDPILAEGVEGKSATVSVQVSRVFPVRIKVIGDIKHNLILNNIEHTVEDRVGTLHVYSIHKNLSTIPLTPYADIEVTDSFGTILYEGKNIKLPKAKPKQENRVEIPTNNFAMPESSGVFEVKLKLRYSIDGLDEETIYESGHGKLKIYQIPVTIVGISLILLLLIILVWIGKKVVYRKLVNSSKIYIVQPNETIQTLETKFKVKATKIIKANSLKAPYFISPQQEILIPQ